MKCDQWKIVQAADYKYSLIIKMLLNKIWNRTTVTEIMYSTSSV